MSDGDGSVMQFGSYRLLRRIDTNGVGVMWEAEDLRSDQRLAVTILPASMFGDAAAQDRVLRNVALAVRENLGSLALGYAIEEADGVAFLVFDSIDGERLAALNLPAAFGHPPPDDVLLESAPTGESLLGTKRMLVAEDDMPIRRLFVTLGRRAGLRTDEASNGAQAIAYLLQTEYDLVFLDLMMPRINGWGVLDFLATHARTSARRLFVVTAFSDARLDPMQSEVVTGILYKPVDADELSRLMRAVANDHSFNDVLQKTRHRFLASTLDAWTPPSPYVF